MLIAYFPDYDRRFFNLLGMFPGQFLFLFLFFPFIAYWSLSAKQAILKYISSHSEEVGRPAHVLWRLIVSKNWGITAVGLTCGVLLASADLIATSRGPDQLPKEQALTTLLAIDVIMRTVQHGNPHNIIAHLKERSPAYDHIGIEKERLTAIANENVPRLERNKRIVETVVRGVSADLKAHSPESPKIALQARRALQDQSIKELEEERLLDAIVYAQVQLDTDLNPQTGLLSGALVVTNFLELVAVVYVAAHLACLSWVMIYMRIRVIKQKRLSPTLVRAAASLIWVTVLLGLWPALRLYTINELAIIFPSGTTLHAPMFVYVFCLIVALFLAGAFLRNQWLQVGSIVVGLFVSVISFVISIKNVFLMREIIGSGASLGNLLMVMVASTAVLVFVGSLLLPEEDEETVT